jgi:hypothetical protein
VAEQAIAITTYNMRATAGTLSGLQTKWQSSLPSAQQPVGLQTAERAIFRRGAACIAICSTCCSIFCSVSAASSSEILPAFSPVSSTSLSDEYEFVRWIRPCGLTRGTVPAPPGASGTALTVEPIPAVAPMASVLIDPACATGIAATFAGLSAPPRSRREVPRVRGLCILTCGQPHNRTRHRTPPGALPERQQGGHAAREPSPSLSWVSHKLLSETKKYTPPNPL